MISLHYILMYTCKTHLWHAQNETATSLQFTSLSYFGYFNDI